MRNSSWKYGCSWIPGPLFSGHASMHWHLFTPFSPEISNHHFDQQPHLICQSQQRDRCSTFMSFHMQLIGAMRNATVHPISSSLFLRRTSNCHVDTHTLCARSRLWPQLMMGIAGVYYLAEKKSAVTHAHSAWNEIEGKRCLRTKWRRSQERQRNARRS